MTRLQVILASVWHYRRVHLAVAAGVAVATAVITGALLVGDSVRGSLRDLALQRLGRIDTLLVAEQPFRQALADQLAGSAPLQPYEIDAAPLLVTPGTLATAGGTGTSRRATRLTIVGCNDLFWSFGDSLPAKFERGGCALTRAVAAEVGVSVGDEVLLRLPLPGSVPADSTLGEKTEATVSLRSPVVAVLPNEGLARFSLRPSQHEPRNVFLPLTTLQRALDLPARINMVALGSNKTNPSAATAPLEVLEQSLSPTLEDFNIVVDQPDGFAYVRITAKRLVLPAPLVEAARKSFPDAVVQPAITYLANTIRVGQRQVPYSTVTAIESNAAIGPLLDAQDRPIVLQRDEVALNDWAAEQLQAELGDTVTLTYYEPETTHGRLSEAAPLQLKLRAIVPLGDQPEARTLASDPNLTPSLPGVTDQRSINDWDLPFELVETISASDEKYWDDYSTTPKAFLSPQLGREIWATRWGTDSVLRIPTLAGATPESVRQRLQLDPADLGMKFLPLRQQALRAARGTTGFASLFLGFSFFLMASAVMLIALLVRLGVEARCSEVGVLSAVGYGQGQLRRLLLGEAALVALAGVVVGTVAGTGYARLMIHGLSTWWLAATVTPFLQLHTLPSSLAVGSMIGLVVALLTMWWALRSLTRLPTRQLISGDYFQPNLGPTRLKRPRRWMPRAMLAAAAGLAGLALGLQGEAQAGAFFGSGALVLGGLLLRLAQQLGQASQAPPQRLSLVRLAARNARRNPSRTILSVGLAAVASFLIVALSAFRLAPSEQGTGGFSLVATTDQPIHLDLNRRGAREELGFGDRDNQLLGGVTFVGMRVRRGEDASCLNLYQTEQPDIVGVPGALYDQGKFGWSAVAGELPADAAPWHVLDLQPGADTAGREIVPVVLDKNTAAYSLHLSGLGAEFTVRDALDQPATLRVAGLLAGSVLQGKVLMSESNLLRLFPETAGQQFFLIGTSPTGSSPEQVSTALESALSDYGLDAIPASQRLAQFLAVQNTYLSTFQTLGALGLLLGTVGLAIAQLRSVLDRRGELALLRSAGFRRSRIARMVLSENAVLLVGGLGIGCLAAAVAVLPHWLLEGASLPWGTLAALLLAIVLAGLAAGWLAVRAAVRAPLLLALGGD